MKITINNTEVELKSKMRAYVIYEQILGKAFNPKSILEMLLFFYSIVMANEPSLNLTFDEFLDYLDEHPQLIDEFKKWVDEENRKAFQFDGDSKKN